LCVRLAVQRELGDQRGSTAAEGSALLDSLICDLIEQFDSWLVAVTTGAL
jgi:hypothetical protein